MEQKNNKATCELQLRFTVWVRTLLQNARLNYIRDNKIGRKTYKLRYFSVVTNISFFVGIFISPLSCRHTEKRNVQNVCFACIHKRRLFFGYFKGYYDIVFNRVGVNTVIYLCEFTFNRPTE